MDVTVATWLVSLTGLMLMGVLMSVQGVAVLRPRAPWTVTNVYGGSPDRTDPEAYYAFNQGQARADVFFWGPLQVAASFGMVMGQRWGFLLGLIASVPFWYSAILIYVWDRDLGFRRNTLVYWCIVWGVWPVFGVTEMVYCFWRLM